MSQGRETAPQRCDGMGSSKKDGVDVFIGTKKIRKHGTSQAIVLEKQWGFNRHEYVAASIKKVINDGSTGIKVIKKVSTIGNSSVIFCDRQWGFKVGDWVYVSVKKSDYIPPEPVVVEDDEPGDDVHGDIIEKVLIDDIGI